MEEILVCKCGGHWFERKTLCRFQLGSKIMQEMDFVPMEIRKLVRCPLCGLFYNLEGNIVDPTTLPIPEQ